MTQTAIPYILMRGGTSKDPYFRREDLPEDLDTLSEVLIAAVGSGHALNIDGIGGGAAGYPSRRGGRTKGSAADYSLKAVRDREREATGHAEEVYRRFVAKWKRQPPMAKPVSPQHANNE